MTPPPASHSDYCALKWHCLYAGAAAFCSNGADVTIGKAACGLYQEECELPSPPAAYITSMLVTLTKLFKLSRSEFSHL